MSVLSTYIHKEQELKRLQAELEALKDNSQLQDEIAFKERLEALMVEYDKTKRDVISLLNPEHFSTKTAANKSNVVRKQRQLKSYENPHTGQVIKTRGGNHKGIREWKDKYGEETVNSWATDVEA